MKKMLCFVCGLCLLTTTGCGIFKKENKPEDVGKKYIEERFDGKEFDVSGLEYTVLEQTEDKSVVKISGPIYFTDEIQLVKEGPQWKLATETGPEATK
jgi:hypothetical protein